MCQAIRGVRGTPEVRRERVITGKGFAVVGHLATYLLITQSSEPRASL